MNEFLKINQNLGQSNKLRYENFTTYQNYDLRLYISHVGLSYVNNLFFAHNKISFPYASNII